MVQLAKAEPSDGDLPPAVRAVLSDPALQADADAAFRALVTVAEAWMAAVAPGRC